MNLKILSYLSLFLLIFDLAIPPVKFIGSAPLSLLISFSVLFMKNKNKNDSAKILLFFKPFYVIYFCFIIFAIVRIIFSEELNYFLSILKSAIIFMAAVLYLISFGSDRINDKIINVFFANGVICLVAGSVPELLNLVHIFKSGASGVDFIPYRNAFLSGSGYFGIASAYSIVFLLCAHKLVKDGLSVGFLIKYLIILIAGILAGRTAFIGIAISLIYIMTKSIKYTLFGVLLIITLVCIVFSVDALSEYTGWMFEFISINNHSVSLATTSSTNELGNMYFMPKNDLTWLFGDGRYVDGNGYYMQTDVGYMRNLFFGGLPFLGGIITFACLFAIKSKSNFFILFILPLLFVLHSKGAFILNNPAGVAILTLLSYWFYHERIRNK